MLAVRNYLDSKDFLEITTPIMSKSTPEGARDYLVPSRIYPGNFYALPQSPQIFKQLLMISGMDKYFQIAQCFRDEDLRSDRQPEFTQIDIEMSFGKPENIYELIEGIVKNVFKDCLGKEFQIPFLKMSYEMAKQDYGTDRPDLRFDMKLYTLGEIVKDIDFEIIKEQIKKGAIVKGICVKKAENVSRKIIDEYTAFVSKFGLKGLMWMKRKEGKFASSIVKYFSEKMLDDIAKVFNVEDGDLVLIAVEKEDVVNQALDHLRRKIAKDRNLIDKDDFKCLWITDFPMFAYDEKENRMKSEHHPFTSPRFEELSLLEKDPLKMKSLAYDLIINGYEVAGGSQRIHDKNLQRKIFKTLNLSDEDILKKFGFFIEALEYGTPPHLGIAFGLDRLVMLLAGTENIKDVIAFPKTQRASDLMSECPSCVAKDQLNELKISIKDDDIEKIWEK